MAEFDESPVQRPGASLSPAETITDISTGLKPDISPHYRHTGFLVAGHENEAGFIPETSELHG